MQLIIYLLLVLISYYSVSLYRAYAIKCDILDHPNHRSSHHVATPRGAGIVIAFIWFLVVWFCDIFYEITLHQWLIFFVPSFLIAIIGFLDDRFELNVLVRAFTHLLCAIWVVVLLHGLPVVYIGYHAIHWQIIGSILAVVAIMWSVNLFNFMDGLDGFAAVEAIFFFGVGGYLIYQASPEAQYIALISWSLVALMLGFLFWNWPKAKIFLGDVGSSFLGFLVMVFALYATRVYNIPLLLWIYLYGLFCFDATITLIRRMAHGDKVYQSHNLHAYQRLHQAGFSHRQVLYANILLNALISVLVLWAYYVPNMLLWNGAIEAMLLLASYLWVEFKKPMYGKK